MGELALPIVPMAQPRAGDMLDAEEKGYQRARGDKNSPRVLSRLDIVYWRRTE